MSTIVSLFKNIKRSINRYVFGPEIKICLKAISKIVNEEVELYNDSQNRVCEDPSHVSVCGKDNYFCVRMKESKKVITSFKLTDFPGCCGLVISTGVTIRNEFRGKGINMYGNRIRCEIARISGFGAIVCTDVDGNLPERKTLARNGWTDVFTFVNPRTGNKLNITVKNLT